MTQEVTRTQAYEALIHAKATLETTALYFQQQFDIQSQAVLGMLMAAALIMQNIQDAMKNGKI